MLQPIFGTSPLLFLILAKSSTSWYLLATVGWSCLSHARSPRVIPVTTCRQILGWGMWNQINWYLKVCRVHHWEDQLIQFWPPMLYLYLRSLVNKMIFCTDIVNESQALCWKSKQKSWSIAWPLLSAWEGVNKYQKLKLLSLFTI